MMRNEFDAERSSSVSNSLAEVLLVVPERPSRGLATGVLSRSEDGVELFGALSRYGPVAGVRQDVVDFRGLEEARVLAPRDITSEEGPGVDHRFVADRHAQAEEDVTSVVGPQGGPKIGVGGVRVDQRGIGVATNDDPLE